MKCNRCGKDMILQYYVDDYKNKEIFIYECKDCGVLEKPKPNRIRIINLNKIRTIKKKK